MKKQNKNILPQMFDVRPVNKSGDLDLEKIYKLEKTVRIEKPPKTQVKNFISKLEKAKKLEDIVVPSITEDTFKKLHKNLLAEKMAERKKQDDIKINPISFSDINYRLKKKIQQTGYASDHSENKKVPQKRCRINCDDFENIKNVAVEFKGEKNCGTPEYYYLPDETEERGICDENKIPPKKDEVFIFRNFFSNGGHIKKYFWVFGKFAIAAVIGFFLVNFAFRGIKLKNQGMATGEQAFAELVSAKDSLKNRDFQQSSAEFGDANAKLSEISKELDGMGGILLDITKYIPYLSKVSSGSHLVAAGKDISETGVIMSSLLLNLENIKSGSNGGESISYLKLFQDNENSLKKIADLLKDTQNNLDSVNLDDIPADKKDQFVQMKQQLPEINSLLEGFLGEDKIFTDILGGNGPRKYLFLFQNNQEMRPTGGFIGSYGILDIFDGRIRNFKIDGIFNPDGQLQTRIIPPDPIQKISANWSLHDSNWFPDFPTSAEKAIWFYEKTGGPTVDGVITMTPTVMQKLLEITGPIDMPDYGVTVDKDNFIEKIQYETEIDYDKELNQPKKILGDLAPLILDKIFNSSGTTDIMKAMNEIVSSLNEKHILIYSRNLEVEKILSENGWTGEILNTQKDYLSVINTNINGFKTDGEIDEAISHKAEIQSDGSIVDTVNVTRHHNGGDTPYEWWNKVNADYMRIYVPKGSRLISVSGQTREFDSPPLDYATLGYQKDPQVEMENQTAQIDQDSGTRISEDAGKTVFGNWVYVSPKETATITYTYALPFKIETSLQKPADTYSLLAQKQSGSPGSKFKSVIEYPSAWNVAWQYPEAGFSAPDNLPQGDNGVKMETDLRLDNFSGIAFTK